jgi:hypothetical protein
MKDLYSKVKANYQANKNNYKVITWGTIVCIMLIAFHLQKSLPAIFRGSIWYIFSVAVAFFGFILFFTGFRRLNLKRIVEDMPISKIISMAPGLVKIRGKVLPEKMITAPFSKRACVFYKTARYSSPLLYFFREVEKSFSDNNALYLQDETGYIRIFPGEARIYLGVPDSIKNNSIEMNEEWIIVPGDEITVLGTCSKLKTEKDDELASSYDLNTQIQLLKRSPERLTQLDMNKDGSISAGEWDKGVEDLKRKVGEELEISKKTNTWGDMVISAGEEESLFVISNDNEERFKRDLLFESVRYMVLGVVLAALSIWLYFVIKDLLVHIAINARPSQ